MRKVVSILLPVCFVLVVTALALVENGAEAGTSCDTTGAVQTTLPTIAAPGHTPTGPRPTLIVGSSGLFSNGSDYAVTWLLLAAIVLLGVVVVLLIGSGIVAIKRRAGTKVRGALHAQRPGRHFARLTSHHA
jgi:cytochrome oxidase assembly protein ShyY1